MKAQPQGRVVFTFNNSHTFLLNQSLLLSVWKATLAFAVLITGSGEVDINDGDSDFFSPFGVIGTRTVFGATCLLLLTVIIIFIISSIVAL